MSSWFDNSLDSRRRFGDLAALNIPGDPLMQLADFPNTAAFDTQDQQFRPRGLYSIYGFNAVGDGVFALQLKISGPKGSRSSRPIEVSSAAGNAQRPFLFDEVLSLTPEELLSTTVTDLSGAVNNIHCLILGILNE